MRFTVYYGSHPDLITKTLRTTDLGEAVKDAVAKSKSHENAYLYDAETNRMLYHFVYGIQQHHRENPKMPTLKQLKAYNVGSVVGGGYVASFTTHERAEYGQHILMEWGGAYPLKVSEIKLSPSTGRYMVYFSVRSPQDNPKFRLGQRRIYPVKGKRAPRYKGSLPSRQTTFTSKRKALAASNPRGVKIYGKLIRIEAQKTQKHVCDAECKKANHCYFHDFTSGPSIYGMPDGSLIIK